MGIGKLKTARYLMTVIIVVIAVMTGYLAVEAEPEKDGLSMKVNGGYGEVAHIGSQAPFRISVSNAGANIDGEIQILVDINSQNSIVYAMPVNLPAGSSKELLLYAPVQTANRKVEVRLVKGKRTLKSVSYSFKKLLPPENPVIGILSDDTGAMRELDGIKLPGYLNFNNNKKMSDIAMKRAVAVAAGEKFAAADYPVGVFRLDRNSLPDDESYMKGIDILIISNFDSSSLSDRQIKMLVNWIQKGNMLFIGTGPNSVTTYSGLPEGFKLIKKDKDIEIKDLESIGKYADKSPPSGNMDIITGTAMGDILLSDLGGNPLAVSERSGKGSVTVLAFDPVLSPFSEWGNAGAFWHKLISDVYNRNISGMAQTDRIGSRYSPGNFQYIASQVPETQAPPFTALLILLGVYILVAGPVVYIFLKWKDKRDWNWLVIPAVALIFLAVIYVAGFKTRYTKAVLNNFSIINIDNSSGRIYTDTVMGIFNNKRSDMRLQYGRDSGFEVDPGSNYYDYYNYSPNSPNEEKKKNIIGKMTYSDPYVYDLYNVGMWEPRFIYANKEQDFTGSIIGPVSISEGKFKAALRNTTSFDFRDAFIVLGNNFINIGDVSPGDETRVNVSLNDISKNKRFSDFLDNRYGSNYNASRNRKDPDWVKKQRKRNILENAYNSLSGSFMTGRDKMEITFVAFNYDDTEYMVKINGEEPQKFNTNLIYSLIDITPGKGSEVEIPSGIITPTLETGETAYYDGGYDSGVRVQADGDVLFKFVIPDNIEVGEFTLNWNTYLPNYLKYQQQQKNVTVQQNYGKDKYEFYIYNFKTIQWEKFDKHFAVTGDMSSYIDQNREMRLKSTVTLDKAGPHEILLGIPEIDIRGVAK